MLRQVRMPRMGWGLGSEKIVNMQIVKAQFDRDLGRGGGSG